MQPPEFWTRPEIGTEAQLLRPLGALVSLAARARRRFTPWDRATVPVICIGNLTVGGTGKTPIALAVAELLKQMGEQPHFLTRGYGGRVRGPALVDPATAQAEDFGDEPLLLAKGAPTWVSANRPAGARVAAKAGASVILMDDGFQNPSLYKDLSLLVFDGQAGIGNGCVMPAGPLREPVMDGLARADAVIVTGPENDLIAELAARARLPQLRAKLTPTGVWQKWRGSRVIAFAGIGRPAKFFETLRDLGAQVVAEHSFADHYAYAPEDVRFLVSAAAQAGAKLVTTEKDYVRLPPRLRDGVDYLPVEARFDNPGLLKNIIAKALSSGRLHHLYSPPGTERDRPA